MPTQSFYSKLSRKKNLEAAWRIVNRNGLRSLSADTQREVEEFAKNAPTELTRIAKQIKQGKFKFQPAWGLLIEKEDKKKKRPIVRASVSERIVQRAILDVVQKIPKIRKILNAGHNFGGVSEGGVSEAIGHAFKASQDHPYFIRTDIKSFFAEVPREKAIAPILLAGAEGNQFSYIFLETVTTELDNLGSFTAEERALFPLDEIGVAQGSALSPLICNIYLQDFDKALNIKKRGVVCIRYIDDFILFAQNGRKAHAALQGARKMLSDLGLDAYDPAVDRKKAEEGLVKDGFGFLGCEIHPSQIIPDADSRASIIQKVKKILDDGLKFAKQPVAALKQKMTFAETILRVSNTVRGWGNTYFFCNDDRVFNQLDQKIDALVESFRRSYDARTKSLSVTERRLSIGVRLLADRKRNYSAFKKKVPAA